MKVKDVSEIIEPEFLPIKLEVVLETKEDASNLWHRLEMSDAKVREISDEGGYSSNKVYPPFQSAESYELWDVIDEALRTRGIIR